MKRLITFRRFSTSGCDPIANQSNLSKPVWLRSHGCGTRREASQLLTEALLRKDTEVTPLRLGSGSYFNTSMWEWQRANMVPMVQAWLADEALVEIQRHPGGPAPRRREFDL
jgi:hypothetical protein